MSLGQQTMMVVILQNQSGIHHGSWCDTHCNTIRLPEAPSHVMAGMGSGTNIHPCIFFNPGATPCENLKSRDGILLPRRLCNVFFV